MTSSARQAFAGEAAPFHRTRTPVPDSLLSGPKSPRRREERRFIVNQPATLHASEAGSPSCQARICDISRRGMQLVSDRPVDLASPVRIEWNGREIHGAIRYQRQDGDDYRLGVELTSSWESLVSDVLASQTEELRVSNAVLAEQAAILKQQADLLDLTYDTILVTGLDGTIRSWNHGAEQMYGWSKAEAAGRNSHEMLASVFSTDPREVERELLTKGRWEGELVQARKDGSRIVVASRWALYHPAEGEPPAIMAINSDITAKKQAEEELFSYAQALKSKNQDLAVALEAAREASVVKSRFLASVSHELRTPLNGIIGFSQLLHDGALGALTGDQRECLADVLNCSNHLLSLITQVLDVTKIEAGKMEFQYQTVNLGDLVKETIDAVRAIAAAKRIVIAMRVDLQLGDVWADPAKLRQVVFNYLSNAIKFSPEDSMVDVTAAFEGPGHYRIQVEDYGVGIRAEDLPRLFTEFGQLGPSERAHHGTGLGLAITKRLVEALGGRVGVESEFGRGSRFYAVLPALAENPASR